MQVWSLGLCPGLMLLGLLLMGVPALVGAAQPKVRPPAVAGAFYPGDAAVLGRTLDELLGDLDQAHGHPPRVPAAVIVPHAGYPFSGRVAARTFAGLAGAGTGQEGHPAIERVILLGPSHRYGFSGGALPAERLEAFATPLGQVDLDLEAIKSLRACAGMGGPAAAHDQEHSLEVELPFLQRLAPRARVVPIVVGPRTDAESARELARCLAPFVGPGTVVVASSDFTHHGEAFGYAPFAGSSTLAEDLLLVGSATAGRAAAIDPRGFRQQVEVSGDTVCGARPILVLLELLDHAFTGTGRVVDVTTSGHISGAWDRVVTYAGVRFDGSWQQWRPDPSRPVLGALDEQARQDVLELARATLRSHLLHGSSLAGWFERHPKRAQLTGLAGAFVTLHNTGARAAKEGRLRACMGVIKASEPMLDAVVHAAVSAAHDPRFPPLEAAELDGLHLEVSILSPSTQVSGPEAIEVGRHGVVLSKGGREAVFLPQVAVEQHWDRETMLTYLARKAGLPADAWRSGARFEVFTAQVFGEPE